MGTGMIIRSRATLISIKSSQLIQLVYAAITFLLGHVIHLSQPGFRLVGLLAEV